LPGEAAGRAAAAKRGEIPIVRYGKLRRVPVELAKEQWRQNNKKGGER
jgi:hypothetical protein